MTSTRNGKIALAVLLLCVVLAWAGAAAGQQDRGMGVPADILPEDLQKLDVKDHYIPSDFREVGVLHALNGQVVVVHRADGQAYFGKPGDKIYENDELNTLGDSRCRVRFYSDDVVNMAPDTRFAVETFEDRRAEGEKTSLFSMVKGKAMFYALRLFRYKEARFKVKTPTAIVGVRGTKFGLDVFWLDGGQTAGRPLRVADSGRGFDAYLAQAQGQGQVGGTNVACGDGTLDVTDPATGDTLALVNPNETFNTYTGDKTYDPTNRDLNQIQQASQVREEGEDKEDEAPTQPTVDEGDQDAGEDTALQDTSDITENIVDVTNIETGDETETSEQGSFTPFEGTPGSPLKGYFSAMLLYKSSGNIREGFASQSFQEIDPLNDAFANGVSNPSSWIKAFETNDEDEAEIFLMGEGTSPHFVIEGPTTYLGQYSYVQWGYHMSNTPPFPSIGGTDYELINKYWFVEGFPSSAAEVAAKANGDYNFSGVVHGSFYSKTEQVDLTGTYTSKVHFGSAYVHDFMLSASGGSHTIDFTQSGNATIDSDGQFTISDPDGTFNIDGSSVADWAVNGGHYGPGLQEQAGAFAGFCSSSNHGAWGIFAGQQQP